MNFQGKTVDVWPFEIKTSGISVIITIIHWAHTESMPSV